MTEKRPKTLIKITRRSKPSDQVAILVLLWKGNLAPVLAVFGGNCKVRNDRKNTTKYSLHHYILIAN